ncbi:MAG: hypothetical protein LBJ93_01670 [Clostridiales bacterium]|nr:hypothetical protein [Clostridiales bacterium]
MQNTFLRFSEKLGLYSSRLTNYLEMLRKAIILAEEYLTGVNKFIQIHA